MIQAPIATILPTFIPAILENGVPGYEGLPCVLGEERLHFAEIRSLYAASVFLAALEHAVGKEFDHEQVRQILFQSLSDVRELTSDEKALTLLLIERFFNFKIIRADHPFDDWLCEALWEQFQSIPYTYPSAMSQAVSYGLTVNHSLNKCSLEL